MNNGEKNDNENIKNKLVSFFNNHKISFVLKVVISVIVVIMIIFIAAQSIANVTFSNVTDGIKSVFTNIKPGEGFPCEISSDGAVVSKPLDSCLALFTDGSIIYLNKTAKQIMHIESSYTNPDIKTSNGRALIYDRGTSSFFLTSRSDVLYTASETKGKLDEPIITANVGKNGSLVFGTWAEDGVSRITVFNKKLKNEFYYLFNNDRVLSVAVSDNGKYAAAAVLGAENAQLYSTVYIFKIDESKPLKKVKYDGETLVSLEFLNNRQLSVITTKSKRTLYIKKDFDDFDIDFSTHTLSGMSFDYISKKCAVLISEYGSNKYTVYGFNSNGRKSCEISSLESVKNVSCNRSYIAVLSSDKICCYNYNGKKRGEITLECNVDKTELCGGYLYLFSGGNIIREKPNRTEVLKKAVETTTN